MVVNWWLEICRSVKTPGSVSTNVAEHAQDTKVKGGWFSFCLALWAVEQSMVE